MVVEEAESHIGGGFKKKKQFAIWCSVYLRHAGACGSSQMKRFLPFVRGSRPEPGARIGAKPQIQSNILRSAH